MNLSKESKKQINKIIEESLTNLFSEIKDLFNITENIELFITVKKNGSEVIIKTIEE
jgi:hypothetical protein